jgi:hypothetical protein
MLRTTIDRLMVNSPYEEPLKHWRYERELRQDHRDGDGYRLAHSEQGGLS